MNLYEAIHIRKSVRNYEWEPVKPEILQEVLEYYKATEGLNAGIQTDMAVIDNTKGQCRIMGLFQVKAPYYLAIYTEEKDRAQMNAGYIMEQLSLFLWTRGLGSCFLGGAVPPKSLRTKNDKKLVILMAFGKAKDKKKRRPFEANRMSLDELCVYKEVPRQWMKQLLEGARLAPSSMNSQPWRFVVYDNRIHIFAKKHSSNRLGKWEEFNFGIMLANLMIVAEELWLDVDLIRLDDISHKKFSNNQYIISAILRT